MHSKKAAIVKRIVSATAILLLLPSAAFAGAAEGTLTDLGDWILDLVNYLSILFVILGTLIWIFGAFRYGTSGANEEAKQSAKRLMINSIIGIFFIASLWGIMSFVFNAVVFEDLDYVEPPSPAIPV